VSLLFIFDMDDVLYDYNWRVRMDGMATLTGLPFSELRRRWWNEEGEWAAEAGVYETAEDYLAAQEDALGVSIDVDEWVRLRRLGMTPWPESIAAVERAAELGQVTLLTNNGALVSRHLRTLAPEIAGVFGDHLYTSSDYFARKPNPLVFERVLERYGAAASDTFFADDRPENVAGAASVGIDAHLFESSASMLAAIERFAAARP